MERKIMSKRLCFLLVVCVLFLLPLTSCSKPKSSDKSAEKSASKEVTTVSSFKGTHDDLWSLKASSPFLIGGYGDNFNYDGSNVSPLFGKAMVKLDANRNAGIMVVNLKGTINPQKGKTYTGDITMYYRIDQGGPAYREGGVADFIYLHGDTKQGPPLMPKLRTYLAAWGSADVYVNDKLVYQNLDGHMMLTERSRDIKTRAIYNKDRSGFYSPNDPSNASIADPDSQELHFVAHSSQADKKNVPPHTVWIHINFEHVKDISSGRHSREFYGKRETGMVGHHCPQHARKGCQHGQKGCIHGQCKGDCDCGCKDGKPCAMVDGKCEGNCECGCEEGKTCDMTGALCGEGCLCGCGDGKPCTCVKHIGKCETGCACGCGESGICALSGGDCGPGCTCGCVEGKPCNTISNGNVTISEGTVIIDSGTVELP
jgi:hypothetical protein